MCKIDELIKTHENTISTIYQRNWTMLLTQNEKFTLLYFGFT